MRRGPNPPLQASLQHHEEAQRPSDARSVPAPTDRANLVMLGDDIINRQQSADPAFVKGEYIDNGGGDESQPHRILDLLLRIGSEEAIREISRRGVAMVVLHVGTHNLTPHGPLTSSALRDYEHMLEILHGSLPTTALLVTGLLPRRDLGGIVVNQSNNLLARMVKMYNQKCRKEIGRSVMGERDDDTDIAAYYLPPPQRLCNRYFSDNVHLNQEGYRIWNESVAEKAREVMRSLGVYTPTISSETGRSVTNTQTDRGQVA